MPSPSDDDQETDATSRSVNNLNNSNTEFNIMDPGMTVSWDITINLLMFYITPFHNIFVAVLLTILATLW